MNYLSVCSGIEAATVAWHHMGWKPVGFSEIEKFPSQVLAHHYPQVTNFGDMTKYKEWKLNDSIGLLVGGTLCQSFSIAGLRIAALKLCKIWRLENLLQLNVNDFKGFLIITQTLKKIALAVLGIKLLEILWQFLL